MRDTNQDMVKRRELCALAGPLQRRYRDDSFFSHGLDTKDQPAFCYPRILRSGRAKPFRTVRLRGHTNRGVKVPTGQSTGCP